MKNETQAICDVLNLVFGWRGADAEHSRERGYTGRVILSARAAGQVVALHEHADNLEARVIYLTRQLYGDSALVPAALHAELRDESARPVVAMWHPLLGRP